MASKQSNSASTNGQQPVLLLVDDEPNILSALKRCLASLKVNLVTFSSPQAALEYTANNPVHIVISDQRMPGMEGCDMLAEIRKQWPESQRLLLSAHHDFDAVTTAFNQKLIQRYISKPWDDEELRFVITKALADVRKDSEAWDGVERRAANQSADTPVNFHGMISASPAMFETFNFISKAATANVPVFITGNTGCGKELAARACHRESYHQGEPFVAVNCANFTEHLIESQLFGHKKGAFTGAISNQPGLFAAAGEGTLFLDEVTTLPLPFQAKLLRVIQEREFAPLGSQQIQPFNAQLVTASSTALSEAVAKGEFREDLFYRLNVISIGLPPLCQRDGDALLLARHFLARCSEECGKTFTGFTPEAEQRLLNYDWPGNVRQLENMMRGLVAMNDGDLVTEEMLIQPLSAGITSATPTAAAPSEPAKSQPAAGPNDDSDIVPLADVERAAIEDAIRQCDGNIPKAAAMLGVSPSTIYRKKQSWSDS
ncbi:sigma-54-dependent Fis family transcriptional regulator [bacterium SCSIO 12696]|nr:sigma-54-dependent Fis family transcriptional regulator [bacterium SCSIO 12696]